MKYVTGQNIILTLANRPTDDQIQGDVKAQRNNPTKL
jgi:hypothetical protein